MSNQPKPAQLDLFTKLVSKEMGNIFVYEDAKGEENHIVMHKEASVITDIHNVKPQDGHSFVHDN